MYCVALLSVHFALEINFLVFGIINLVLTQRDSISLSAFHNITTGEHVQSPHTLYEMSAYWTGLIIKILLPST